MAEIDMPGDEVRRVGNLLGRVMELVETKASGFNGTDVGAPMARSGSNFDRKRNDGRVQLKRNGKVVKDACEAIVKAFEDTDDDRGKQLDESRQKK